MKLNSFHTLIQRRPVLSTAGAVGLLGCAAWMAWIPWCNSAVRSALQRRDLLAAEHWMTRAMWLPNSSADAAFLRARLSRRLGRLDRFGEELDRAVNLGLSRQTAQLELDLAKAQAGDVTSLESQLPTLLMSNRDLSEVCDVYVNACMHNYNLEEAHRVLDVWQADYPEDPQPHFLRGRLFEHQSNLDEAESEFRQTLKKSPHHAPAAFNLARILVSRQRHAEALKLYELAAADLAEPQPALVAAARCERELGELDAARRTLERASQSSSGRLIESYCLVGEHSESALAQLPAEWGQLNLAEDHFQDAVTWFEKSLAANPLDSRVRYAYATALRRVGRATEADEQLKFVEESQQALQTCDRLIDEVRRNSANADARYKVGIALMKYHSPNQGLVWLKSVVQIDPHHQQAHERLAEYYTQHRGERREYAELATKHRQLADESKTRLATSSRKDTDP